jgi:hypothetical protein
VCFQGKRALASGHAHLVNVLEEVGLLVGGEDSGAEEAALVVLLKKKWPSELGRQKKKGIFWPRCEENKGDDPVKEPGR